MSKGEQRVQSHLYEEYKLASKLASIKEQREIQAEEIRRIDPESILSIGIGYGEEINEMIEKLKTKYALPNSLGKLKIIQWIDLNEDAGKNLKINEFASLVKIDADRIGSNLLEIKNENIWDCIQCSFVLHDVMYDDKEEAISTLHKALKPGGQIIVSEIFLDNKMTLDAEAEIYRKSSIDDLYGLFYEEIMNIKDVDTAEIERFKIELLNTKENAKRGKRDFFLNKENSEKLFSIFSDVRFTQNAKNPYMGVITAKKNSVETEA